MNFELKTLSLAAAAKTPTETLIVLISEHFQAGKDPLSALIEKAIKAKDFSAKAGKTLQAYAVSGVSASKIVLVGIGEGKAGDVKSGVMGAMTGLKSAETTKTLITFASTPTPANLHASILAVAEGTYVYGTTHSKPKTRKLTQVVLGVAAANAALKEAFATSVAMVQGIEFAKEWANRPANHATPTLLGKAAQGLAKTAHISCDVLGPKEVAKLGMGSFMSVAQGSAETLRFIILKYQGAAKTDAPVVLVGKGITFDTGGISIKPAPEMDEMKFDMGGAASVLGVFKSLSLIRPKLKPKAVIDIATLTGACVIALGAIRSGMFASEDSLAEALQNAGNLAMDLCWRMPLDEEYAESLRSNFADVGNVGGRAGGAITAAKFLQRFAKKYPWAHLDIAGTAWKGGAAKGATGRPVGLLLQYLLSQQVGVKK